VEPQEADSPPQWSIEVYVGVESEEHYLKRELYEKFGRGAAIFEFLQLGSLDGI